MNKFITPEKITQFQRATSTTGNDQLAIVYLESEEGDVNDAVTSYQADQRSLSSN